VSSLYIEMSLVPKFPPPFSYPNPAYSKSLGFWFLQHYATDQHVDCCDVIGHHQIAFIMEHLALCYVSIEQCTICYYLAEHQHVVCQRIVLRLTVDQSFIHLLAARAYIRVVNQLIHDLSSALFLVRHSPVRRRLQPCHQPPNRHLQLCRLPPLGDWGPAYNLVIQWRAVDSIILRLATFERSVHCIALDQHIISLTVNQGGFYLAVD
jgi:hypothetical protein